MNKIKTFIILLIATTVFGVSCLLANKGNSILNYFNDALVSKVIYLLAFGLLLATAVCMFIWGIIRIVADTIADDEKGYSSLFNDVSFKYDKYYSSYKRIGRIVNKKQENNRVKYSKWKSELRKDIKQVTDDIYYCLKKMRRDSVNMNEMYSKTLIPAELGVIAAFVSIMSYSAVEEAVITVVLTIFVYFFIEFLKVTNAKRIEFVDDVEEALKDRWPSNNNDEIKG